MNVACVFGGLIRVKTVGANRNDEEVHVIRSIHAYIMQGTDVDDRSLLWLFGRPAYSVWQTFVPNVADNPPKPKSDT